jgi:excisionase family DNA binding protein
MTGSPSDGLTDTGDRPYWTDRPTLSEKPVPWHSGRGSTDPGHPTTHRSFPSPPPYADTEPDQNDLTDHITPTTARTTGDPVPLLYTPAQAAAALQVRESWLRRRAARREVPCTFLGKHLRFSRTDLDAIVAQAARTTARPPRTTSPHGPATTLDQRRTASSRPAKRVNR